MTRLAVFASGSGTNAEKIIHYFSHIEDIEVALIVCNKNGAGVLDIAERNAVSSMVIDRDYFYQSNQLLFELNQHSIDFIVLAGFLWLVPTYLTGSYRKKIINIHPALLPKYGGKGMYGMNVHKAVKAANEKETGITIHFVNEKYDEGTIIFQSSCPVEAGDSPEDIQKKVQVLEHTHFPKIIEQVVRS